MYTLIANDEIKKWLNNNLGNYSGETTNKYIEKVYIHDKFKITLYKTNTLLIDGLIKNRIYSKLILKSNENNFLGSDEVGVGDFFGPTVYCTVYLEERSLENLSSLFINIKDSKKISNDEILEIYKKIKTKVKFTTKVIYDHEIDNLNSIEQKIVYHHKNYLNLSRYAEENGIIIKKNVIDLFTTEKSFYKYSKKFNLSWESNIHLETKADSKYLCVALASIIARAKFLEEIEKIKNKYKIEIPLGSVSVKSAIEEFISKYGKEELALICKTTFKTFKEI